MRLRYTRMQMFEIDINHKNYDTDNTHQMLLVDLDDMKDSPELFFDRKETQSQFKVELIEGHETKDHVCG